MTEEDHAKIVREALETVAASEPSRYVRKYLVYVAQFTPDATLAKLRSMLR